MAASKIAVIAGIGPGTVSPALYHGSCLCRSSAEHISQGAAVASAFSKLGYSVALLARSHESLETVRKSILEAGGKAESFPTDVSDEASVINTFRNIGQKLPGDIEVGIFNASAGFTMKPFLELKTQDIEQAFKVSAWVHYEASIPAKAADFLRCFIICVVALALSFSLRPY